MENELYRTFNVIIISNAGSLWLHCYIKKSLLPKNPNHIALWLLHNHSPGLTMKNQTHLDQMENYLITHQIANKIYTQTAVQ